MGTPKKGRMEKRGEREGAREEKGGGKENEIRWETEKEKIKGRVMSQRKIGTILTFLPPSLTMLATCLI